VKRTWQQIRAPQSQLNHWLRQADLRFVRGLARGLKKWSLLASEWEALRQMYHPGRTSPVALARALGMTKGGASKLIDRLVRKGLVLKEISSFDRRYRSVGLTRAGKRLVPALASLVDNTERDCFGSQPTDGQHGLMDALKRVIGAAHKRYLNIWVSTDGAGGQWAYERAGWLGT
jgi:DNA-binding MarR family transcriptional regulator